MGRLDMGRLCEELEAQVPSPAAGSALAAVGAIAASLVVMVGNGSPEWAKGAEAVVSATTLRDQLLTLGGQDADVVAEVVASGPRHDADPAAHDRSLVAAADVPLEIAGRLADVADLARLAVAHGKPVMRADAGAAHALAVSAARVALSIVSGNISRPEFPFGEAERVEKASRLVAERVAVSI